MGKKLPLNGQGMYPAKRGDYSCHCVGKGVFASCPQGAVQARGLYIHRYHQVEAFLLPSLSKPIKKKSLFSPHSTGTKRSCIPSLIECNSPNSCRKVAGTSCPPSEGQTEAMEGQAVVRAPQTVNGETEWESGTRCLSWSPPPCQGTW